MFLTMVTASAAARCMLSCIQLTRSVLISTVKDACWEIIYLVPLILPLWITFEITRSIHAKKREKEGLLKIFLDCIEQNFGS